MNSASNNHLEGERARLCERAVPLSPVVLGSSRSGGSGSRSGSQ